MPKSKRKKTLADYIVIAISPLLIMTLVGSLTFFLLQLTYHGQYEMRLKWILFWFILAAVLVARIAIEQGTEHATMFGIALTAAVGLAAIRLVDEFLLAWLLLAVCWWCAWKLTWDCTLIDDNADASGEGLLQAAGFRDETAPATPPAHEQSAETEATDASADVEPPATDRPVHAPGKWVVYFSLAALPIFGVGQLLIPAHDPEARAYGFSLLARLRRLGTRIVVDDELSRTAAVPSTAEPENAGRHEQNLACDRDGDRDCPVVFGTLAAAAAGRIQRQRAVDKIDTKLREASRFAVVSGDRAKGEGRRIGQQDPQERKGGDAAPQDRNAQAQRKQGDGQRSEQNGGDQKGESKDGGEGKKRLTARAKKSSKDRRAEVEKREATGSKTASINRPTRARP